ncbi:MAG: twin-arginine translocation signal domain-containing protein [Patescibacteria group bacterium]
MISEDALSRRDFLKLSGAGLLGLFLPSISLPRTARALENSFQRMKEGQRKGNNDIKTIIYEGQTRSIDKLSSINSKLPEHIEKTLKALKKITDSNSTPSNAVNYRGGSIPNFNILSPTIKTTKTKDNKLMTQVLIGRSGGIMNLQTSLLLVMEEKEDNPCWVDRIDSGESKIVVNGETGSVYQATRGNVTLNGILQGAFKGSIVVEKLNINTKTFEPIMLPGSPDFINNLAGVMSPYLSQNLDETFYTKFYSEFLSTDATSESRSKFLREYNKTFDLPVNANGYTGDQNKWIDFFTKFYDSNIPMNMDMAIDIIGAFRILLESDQTDLAQLVGIARQNGNFSILAPKDTISNQSNDPNRQDLMTRIAERNIHLPFEVPRLIKFKIIKGSEIKWVLAAGYSADDMYLDTPQKIVIPGETTRYIDESIDENGLLNNGANNDFFHQFKTTNNLDIDLKYWEKSRFGDGWNIDQRSISELADDNVRLFYDSEQNRIFSGAVIQNGPNQSLIEIKPGAWFEKTPIKQQAKNRWYLFSGNNPYGVLDVTDTVRDHIKQGYTDISQFALLKPIDAAAMILGLMDTDINYYNLNNYLGLEKIKLPINIQMEGAEKNQANSYVVVMDDNVPCYHYSRANGFSRWKRDENFVTLQKKMLLGAYKIEQIEDKDMVVIADDNKNKYYVPAESVMFVGVKSSLGLLIKDIVLVGALAFGAYKLSTIPIGKGTIGDLITKLLKSIIGR